MSLRRAIGGPHARDHLLHLLLIVAHLILASQRWFGPELVMAWATRNLLFIKFYEAHFPVAQFRNQLMMMDGKTMHGLGSGCLREIPSRTQARTVVCACSTLTQIMDGSRRIAPEHRTSPTVKHFFEIWACMVRGLESCPVLVASCIDVTCMTSDDTYNCALKSFRRTEQRLIARSKQEGSAYYD
jgi:hypothetical protein